MADKTTVQTSFIPEHAEADEFCENIPPGVTAAAETSKLQVQGDVVGYSPADPSGENKPLSENYTFSTPAAVSHSGGAKTKSRMSGLQSALTPILKYLNIGNKCSSPEPLKCGNSPHLGVPPSPFGVTTASCNKSAAGSSQHPNSSHCGRSLGDKDSPVYWLQDECLPEITLLDCTYDSTMQIISTEGNTSGILPPKLSKHNGTTASTELNAKMVDTPDRKGQRERWLDDRYFPEITLLDVTRDSELSPAAEMSPMEVTQDVPPVEAVNPSRPSSELSGFIVAEPEEPVVMQTEELSSTLTAGVAHTTSSFSEQSKCLQENVKSSSEDVSSVLENKSQTSAEDTLGTHPTNVTRDISSSSDMSAQSAASQLSASDEQSNGSLKNVTIEIHGKLVETSVAEEAIEEELLTGRDTESTGKEPQTGSGLSESTDQIPCPQNKTLDLPPSDVNSPKKESVAADPVSVDNNNTPETSLDLNQNSSAAQSGGSCDVQNGTFDIHSLQKSCGSSTLGETGAATFCLQNNTFDSKPCQQNGTITITETSSRDSHQDSLDKPSPSKVCNPTPTSKENTFDVHAPDVSKQNGTGADPDVKMADTPENTFEANPAVAPAASGRDTRDHSQSVPDGLSESLGHQGTETENNQANTFNLDDTLDLKVDSLVTSTPMTHCKVLHFTEHDHGKAMAAQKKLYGDGTSKPGVQASTVVPSNIITDRKTLIQPPAKFLLRPLKSASQLLKYNPTSTLPGRCEPATSRLPMTRQRTQSDAVKNPAHSAQGTTGIASSYNLRATTTASKQPNSGLPRPPMSSIPSGIQRSAPGLRPPSAKSNAGPAEQSAAYNGTKFTQPKKHPLTKGEPLPTAKRKKTDGPVPSSGAEASTACDAVNGFKNPKRPGASCNQRVLPAKAQRDDAAVPVSTAAAENTTSCNAATRSRNQKPPVNSHRAQPAKPQGHGCAKCVVLEEQLKVKSEEIKRLKEELLKHSEQAEEC